MTEMNARTLMFNLGPIDSTTLVKIARYAVVLRVLVFTFDLIRVDLIKFA